MPSYSIVCPDANFVVNGLRQAGRFDTEIAAQWASLARDRARLLVPSLLLIEVTNVLYQLERGGKLSPDETSRLLEAATLIPFELVEYPNIHREALEIARALGQKATYDAHYVAVARQERIPLITSDRGLVSSVNDGYIETIYIPFVNVNE
jgi:predicted nucleic acid-binding protein